MSMTFFFRCRFLLCLTLCHPMHVISIQSRDLKYVHRNLDLNQSGPCLTKLMKSDTAPDTQDVMSPLGNPRKFKVEAEDCRTCKSPIPGCSLPCSLETGTSVVTVSQWEVDSVFCSRRGPHGSQSSPFIVWCMFNARARP